MPHPPDHAADFLRRERVTDALLEFERRIREGSLAISPAECWDLLLNRPPAPYGHPPHAPADPLPLGYETRDGLKLLRVNDASAVNRACLRCDLFGRSHCCGGLAFLYYALRDAGVANPLEWLAVEVAPGLYLPDWERLRENSARIARKLRDYFEAHLEQVSAGELGD